MTKSKLKRGDRIEAVAQTLTASGRAIVTYEGWALEIAGLLPGEGALIRVEHLSRQGPRGHATLLERRSDHPHRREAPCLHHDTRDGVCGGCPLMTLEEIGQRELKENWVRERLALPLDRIEFDDHGLGYRHSAKRVIAGRAGQLTFGSYRKGTHHVADMRSCLVDHALLRETFEELAELANARGEAGLAGYHEQHAPSGLRYAWAKTNGREVMLTLVTGDGTDGDAISALAENLSRPSSIAWSTQGGRGNRMRGGEPTVLRGPETLVHEGQKFGPDSFMQPNPAVARLAQRDLLQDPAGTQIAGRTAIDLYAGTGTTTARLRERFDQVRGCEVEPNSAALAGVDAISAEEFLTAEFDEPDVVIANPPRAGLGLAVCDALCRVRGRRLHIMSCNPESLARDLQSLASAYTVENVRGYDTLPQTPHLELVAWLSR